VSEAQPKARRGWLARARDPRLWLGLIITGVTVWLAVRGVSLSALAEDLSRANVALLLAYSVPCYLLGLYVRALRWRHLTDPVQSITTGPLLRATAIGFMVNNLVPLRVGEVVRAWTLSRETGAPGPAILGTVLLERLIDALVVLGLAFVVLGSRGGALPLSGTIFAALVLPIGLVVLLRVAPERVVSQCGRLRSLGMPANLVEWVQSLLRSFADGLGSLRGGRHLFWIAFHSFLIWGVIAPIPFFGTLEALHVDLGSLGRAVAASYVTLVAVGVAVALPSAPGFFGPYHYAARLALTRFGLDESTALAVGTLAHATFWVIITGAGLVVLRFRRTTLDATLEAAASDSE
jgi:uncharacterized protein (TIRG00374 family)